MRVMHPNPRRCRWPAVALVAVWACAGAWAGSPERSAFALGPNGNNPAPRLRAQLLSSAAKTDTAQNSSVAAPAIKADSTSVTASNTFMTAYLLPKMSARLGDFNTLVGSEIYRNEPAQSVWRGDVDRRVEKQAIRATRSAARDYLVERWNLELDLHRRRASVAAETSSDDAASKVRLGFAGARPRLIWLNGTKNGEVKLSLDSAGRFGAAWHRAADGTNGVAFAADPANKRIELGWASSF